MQYERSRVKETKNNIFDSNEIWELLKGNEDMSAFEFVCRYILEVEPERISEAFETTEQNFLVQQIIENKVYTRICTGNELISYLDMSDCSGEEYKIFDITIFGGIREVFYNGWKPDRLIEVVDREENIILSGYGTDH